MMGSCIAADKAEGREPIPPRRNERLVLHIIGLMVYTSSTNHQILRPISPVCFP